MISSSFMNKGGLCLFLYFLFSCVPLVSWAQSIKMNGKVVSESRPISGATVRVDNEVTQTDSAGLFTVIVKKLPQNVSVHMMGFKALSTSVNVTNPILELESDNSTLDEVVVVGYGTQKKGNLTGSISVVDGKEMTKRSVASASLALQGEVPGLSVRQQSGVPGGDGGGLSIRGIGSINAGANPLVLVDNVEMSLDAVDPNTIESISVLKDASAASIYGSRAANGVILVTTKRGNNGVRINFNSYLTHQEPVDLPKKVNALDHMKLWDVAQLNSGLPAAFTQQITAYEQNGADNFSRYDTNWEDLVLTNNGIMHNHNLNVSAGNDWIKTFVSGGFVDQNGLTANTNLKRQDFRFNTDVKLSEKLSGSFDFVYNKSNRTWPGQSNPQSIIRYMLGLPAIAPGRFDSGEWGEGWSNNNPAAQAQDGGFASQIINTYVLNGGLKYKIIDGLELSANYSTNNWIAKSKTFQKQYDIYESDLVNNKISYARSWPLNNFVSDSFSQSRINLFRAQANYSRKVEDHNFQALLGFSAESFRTDDVSGKRDNLISDDFPYLNAGNATGQTVTGGAQEYSMASVYGRLNYDYKQTYLLELNGRMDASSRFSKDNWWALFPSLSVGWRLSNESFWETIKPVINDAKIRASYGTLGNQNIGSYYPTYTSYNGGLGYNYFFNNAINTGYALSQSSNPNIQWEKSTILDIGIDMALFNSKLNLTVDYFSRDIDNMLQLDLIPSYVGLSAPYVNIGKMSNKGWEFSAKWRDRIGDFTYGIVANFSDVQNKIVDLNDQVYISGSRITKEGYAYNSYFGYIAEGLFQSQEEITNSPFHFANTKAGDIKYKDINGDNKIDANDREVLGNFFPRYEYSFNLNLGYKGIDFSALFQGIGKMDNYLSGTGSQPFFSQSFQGSIYEHQKDYWSPENTDAEFPRLTANSITNNYVTSSYWMRDASFLRLKNVVLGYTLDQRVIKSLKSTTARIYVSGQNLFTASNYFPGFDPEQRDTGGEFYPIMRTFTVGLNLNF